MTSIEQPALPIDSPVYQGQFGEFTITSEDRRGVVVYRAGLLVAAVSFAVGVGLWLWQGPRPEILSGLTLLYACFWIALGVSLVTIHIYLATLHRVLQIFWLIGGLASVALAIQSAEPLALTLYQQPIAILGIGFTFAALTGIFFKEAFCFNRLETKFLTPLVPLVLMGHLLGLLPVAWAPVLLVSWAALFLVFALRKVVQPIPPDIGDKSVFAYLREQRLAAHEKA